jgi:hypothetical protein
MNILRVTASGGPIIRRVHRIWHLHIAFYFFLFGFIKEQLKGIHFLDGQALIFEVR